MSIIHNPAELRDILTTKPFVILCVSLFFAFMGIAFITWGTVSTPDKYISMSTLDSGMMSDR